MKCKLQDQKIGTAASHARKDALGKRPLGNDLLTHKYCTMTSLDETYFSESINAVAYQHEEMKGEEWNSSI